MKHASNPRRGRGRNNGKRNPSSKNRNYESGGSDGRVRGSAQQVLDKFLALARDAHSAGDRIAAEGFFQHAEHYYRVLNPEGAQNTTHQERNRRDNNHNDDQGKFENKSESTEQSAVVDAVAEPVVEAAREPSTQPAASENEAVEEAKSRRRPRTRKAAPAEPTDNDKEASETAA
jgi:hypothetical protein